MKFISSIVLLLAVSSLAVSSLAATINEPKDGGVLACTEAKPVTTAEVKTEWSSTNIYAVQVCAVSAEAVEGCGAKPLFFDNETAATKSSLTLTVTLGDGTAVPITPKEFEVKDLAGEKSFCHTFEICDILKAEGLKKIDLKDSKISAAAVFVAKQKAGEAKPFTVTMKATSYTVDKDTKEVSVGENDVQPFSIISNNYPYTVTADPKLEGSTETLTIVDNQAPQCSASREAVDEAKKLYVSVFQCPTAETCPKNIKFTISDASPSTSPSPSPPSTSQTEASQTGSSQTEGSQTEGSQTEGSQTEGSQTEGSQTVGSQTEGSQTEDSQTESTSGALHITGMGSAFIATILAFIA